MFKFYIKLKYPYQTRLEEGFERFRLVLHFRKTKPGLFLLISWLRRDSDHHQFRKVLYGSARALGDVYNLSDGGVAYEHSVDEQRWEQGLECDR